MYICFTVLEIFGGLAGMGGEVLEIKDFYLFISGITEMRVLEYTHIYKIIGVTINILAADLFSKYSFESVFKTYTLHALP